MIERIQLSASDLKKRNTVEVLLITKLSRAKGIEDETARVYEPGEEGRFSGSAKIQLLAMGNATRDLKAPVELSFSDLSKLTVKQLQSWVKEQSKKGNKIDISGLKTRTEIISRIKESRQKDKDAN